jgi:hypothetical protein
VSPRRFAKRTRQQEKESAMTRETINYARLGVEACEPSGRTGSVCRLCPYDPVRRCATACASNDNNRQPLEPVKSLASLFETKH